MKLKQSQIEFIEKDLIAKGVLLEGLREDLVDHICCEVEEGMNNGLGFMDAYRDATKKFNKRGFPDLNREASSLLTLSTMIRNFFTTAFRIFIKNWTFSAIRVFGLSLGIAVFLISLLYLIHENSYDSFHDNANDIYRIGRVTDRGKIASTAFPLVPTLKQDFPQYTFTHFFKDRSNALFRKEDKSFYENNMIFADKDFLEIFHFEEFKGNTKTALVDPYSVVMTEVAAQKYFDRTVKLGDVLDFKWNGEYYPLKITGLIPKWPANMHIQFEVIISFETANSVFPSSITDAWDMNYCYSYVKLPPGLNTFTFENSFQSFVDKHVKKDEENYQSYLGFLQPLRSIHLQPEVLSAYANITDPNYSKIAVAIGFLVLLITSLNFITLTIAQLHDRAKEVGIRKAIGATRRQVVLQFIFETFLLVTISFLLGWGALYLFVDVFNAYMLTQLTLAYESFDWVIWSLPFFIVLLTIVTGLYPAIFFSGQNIMDTIHLKKRRSGVSLRKSLLTLQYIISATLLTFCIILFKQISFVEGISVGYDKEQVLYIPHGRSIRDNPDLFKTLAKSNPSIQNVSLSFYKPTDNVGNAIDVKVDGKEPVKMAATSVDEDFFDTYKIGFIGGDNFQKEGMDLNSVFILNEAAVKYLQLDDPLSSTLETAFQTGSPTQPFEQRRGKVIGVVKDVHFESLHTAIKPMLFMVKPYWYFYINVRINNHDVSSSLSHLESTWKSLFPDLPFEYTFLDTEFERLYQKEKRLADGLGIMASLAIITTCLGLFGYMRFMAQQKTKEVGIRKVLGADMLQISSLFSKEFIVALLIANIIAVPIGYYTSTWWLQNFEYRIALTGMPFVITFVALVSISFLTILNELINMMKLDPSSTLRYD
ncbi:MAG: FtsX-like permease family protein [Cyclobacteriaceae bacterium]